MSVSAVEHVVGLRFGLVCPWDDPFSLKVCCFSHSCVFVPSPPAPTPCRHDNGNCSHVCVARGRRSGRVEAGCMCPIGHPLLSDQKTCAPGEVECELFVHVVFPSIIYM